MKIKPLRSMVGDYGSLKRNVIATVPDHVAQQLVRRGVAVPVQASEAKEAAGKAATRPSSREEPSRHGGRTGATKSLSSSPAAPASGKQTSGKSKDELGS